MVGYGIEVCATFAPEYHDTERDTHKALIRSAMFCLGVYALLPVALGGVVSQQAMADAPMASTPISSIAKSVVPHRMSSSSS